MQRGCFLCPTMLAIHACLWAGLITGGEPWRWEERRPFYIIASVKASSEDPFWLAWRVADGDTSEPEGLWQTQRHRPREATLELTLRERTKIDNVRIFHQKEPRFYRSRDYTISVKVNGDWRQVASVRDNTMSGWRDHPFPPVETDGIRIRITRSEYGYRMGLNEVEVCPVGKPPRQVITYISTAHGVGRPADMGVIEWRATTPPGTSVRFRTRTAPDANGKPGEWSAWSEFYRNSGDKVTSPVGAWIQYEATLECAGGKEPVLEFVRLGSPETVRAVLTSDYVLRAGQEAIVDVVFDRPIDVHSTLMASLQFSDGHRLALTGRWEPEARQWHASAHIPSETKAEEAIFELSGAQTQETHVLIWPFQERMLVGMEGLKKYLRDLCEWIMSHPSPAIFIEGYNERTVLGAYEMFGEERYLEHAKRWMRQLLATQKPKGYWGTGYGDVYFADTGSALGLLVSIYRYVTQDEQKQIMNALQRYFHLILVEGDSKGRPFIHEDGSMGVGFSANLEGAIKGDLNKPYTISTALTGAGISSAMYHLTGDQRYRKIAVDSLRWIFSTMRDDGQIPYICDDWNRSRKNLRELWQDWPYDTSAYVGEGVIAAWTFIEDPAIRNEIAKMVKPHIEWLLRTQNADGSWAKPSSSDQLRSHGVVNLLLWYHLNVQRDVRIASALRKYISCLLDAERSRLLKVKTDPIATSLVGRAVVDLIRPGTDCRRW